MIVVDASVGVASLLADGESRRVLSSEQLHSPHLVDAEVASSLRRRVAAEHVAAEDAGRALQVWARLGMTRYPISGMLDRIWELRDNVSPYDACYVALAEALDCALVTADGRLSRAPGVRCPITLLPG